MIVQRLAPGDTQGHLPVSDRTTSFLGMVNSTSDLGSSRDRRRKCLDVQKGRRFCIESDTPNVRDVGILKVESALSKQFVEFVKVEHQPNGLEFPPLWGCKG